MESVRRPVRAEIRERLIVARAVDSLRPARELPVATVFRCQHLSVPGDSGGIVEVAVRPSVVAAPRDSYEFLRREYGVLFYGEELRPVLEQHVSSMLNAVQLAVRRVHCESDHVPEP